MRVNVLAVVLLTVGCASMDSGVPFSNDESQEIPTSSHSFIPFATEVFDYSLASGDVTVTYGQGEYKDSSNFPSTEKYKVEDYGFFQITAKGIHNGQNRNTDEALPPQPWDVISTIIRADLNGDSYEDFYLAEAWEGSRDDQPNSHLFAFINNGKGQFEVQKLGCIGYGDLDYKTDPNHQCGFVSHWQRPIVADFNSDGIDDFYKTSILYLSNGNIIENKSLTNLPAFQFQTYINYPDDLVTGPWAHDNYAGDADGDGDLDIFAPYTDVAWAMLINDGSGVFTVNQNFAMDRPTHWATTAAIGDFDNDGYGDVAVGWFNPDETSSGAVYWNDGNNDWRNRDRTNLPANFYGTNGNANDMEVMDFNNDGFIDILLASTTHEPYYKGRVIQFFQNNGNGTFSEWNSYETSGGDSGWFQEGTLHLLDFDKDGDIDIIDNVAPTYVLINEDGNFIFYDEMPTEGRLYPVEIDGKWQYDFISYEMTWAGYIEEEGKHDTSVTTFFQVLDPLTQMAKDITTKPAGYALAASENKLMFSNLRHRQLDGGSDITITNNNKMLGFDIEHGRLHMGMGYARNYKKAQNETVYFGTSSAAINIETYTVYAESLWKKVRFGLAYYLTEVDSFRERGSQFDMEIDSFTLKDIELFVDIRYKDFSLGISKYGSLNDTAIGFQGLKYKHNQRTTMMRMSYLKRF